MFKLDPKTTALILIDLQKGITSRSLAPYTGEQVVQTAKELAASFRKAGAPVILVNVAFAKDRQDALRQPVDEPMQPPPGGFPENFSELAEGLAQPADIRITKRQWGAFYGTELDLQLRRRGITTIVLAGIATNMGVESTARQAWEHGYALIIAEDATTALAPDLHAFAFTKIFPRLSRIAESAAITF